MPEYSFDSLPPGKTLIQLLEKKFTGLLQYRYNSTENTIYFKNGLPVDTGSEAGNLTSIFPIFTDDVKMFSLTPCDVEGNSVHNPFDIIHDGIINEYSKERLLKESQELIKPFMAINEGYQSFLNHISFDENDTKLIRALEEGGTARSLTSCCNLSLEDVLRRLYFLATLKLLHQARNPEEEFAGMTDDLRAFVMGFKTELKRMLKENFFERLNLDKSASPLEITDAFKDRARKYHPDAFVRMGLNNYRDEADNYFGMLTETYNLLSDDSQRKAYIEQISVDPAEMEQVKKVLNAEVSYQKAMIHFRRKEFAEAVENIYTAVNDSPDDGHYLGMWAWIRYSDPAAPREEIKDSVKEALLKAVQLAPREPNLFYYLGKVLLDCNQIGSARQYLSKACELNPDHLEASRELRLLEKRKLREEQGIIAKTGTFLNIFKKK
ncbi:MAG: DnaJ domain-containing protein [Deltaproteobacteria bacterium]|nr:DnaJ domain-containing protein [Deltaproteobacteria bacterium]